MPRGVLAVGFGRAIVLGIFQCQRVMLIWVLAEQVSTVLAVGASEVNFCVSPTCIIYISFSLFHGDGTI